MDVFHTKECRDKRLDFPLLAEGNEQWLGDGFYFWQDYEFAQHWGYKRKCNKEYKKFSIYNVTLEFEKEDFIDTVFNEEDYYQLVEIVEDFAKRYQKAFRKKPTLEEFNDFIVDFDLWNNIKVIRFQDIPINNEYLEVDNYYYKKRIQIRVNEPKIICKFAHYKDMLCI